ncbi:unnamed protein product [Rotaria socialis]
MAFELIFGTSIVNSYLIYKENYTTSNINILQFRESLVRSLLLGSSSENLKPGSGQQSTSQTKYKLVDHKLEEIEESARNIRRRCTGCYEQGRKQQSREASYAAAKKTVLIMPIDIVFINRLSQTINLVKTRNNRPSRQIANIHPGGSVSCSLPDGWSGNFRHAGGTGGITLFEVSVRANDRNVYYDLSVIDGFNVPMKVRAPDGTRLKALHRRARDAYLFPADNSKTHASRINYYGEYNQCYKSKWQNTEKTILLRRNQSLSVRLDNGWEGRVQRITGASNDPATWAEVHFNAWHNMTFADISFIRGYNGSMVFSTNDGSLHTGTRDNLYRGAPYRCKRRDSGGNYVLDATEPYGGGQNGELIAYYRSRVPTGHGYIVPNDHASSHGTRRTDINLKIY